ncbi:hypothetical protein D3C87_1754790 [compost metagenome]
MPDAPRMYELHKNPSAAGMYFIRYAFPAVDLCLVVNSGGTHVADAIGGHGSIVCNDQPRARPLPEI